MTTRREFLAQSSLSAFVGATAAGLTSTMAQQVDAEPKQSRQSYRIPRTDLVVTRIAYGCAMLGIDWDSPNFVAKSVPMINVALEQGITLFDLADVYGHGKAEEAFGEVLKTRRALRNHIVIQSKCGDRFDKDQASVDNSRNYIVGAVDGSLKRLGVDHLDILLLHFPDSLVDPSEVAEAFDRLQTSGRVRYFGVSNHSPYQIELLRRYIRQPLVANQIQLGLGYWHLDPTAPKDVDSWESYKSSLNHGADGVSTLDYCRANGIPVQAYSPLRTAASSKTPLNLLRPAANASPEVKQAVQLIAETANQHDVTPAAVMLAWLLRHPAKIIPIIGATKPEYVIEDCAADRVELSREEWYALLHAAAAAVRSQSSPHA